MRTVSPERRAIDLTTTDELTDAAKRYPSRHWMLRGGPDTLHLYNVRAADAERIAAAWWEIALNHLHPMKGPTV
jgi:hypothetical protein